MGTAPADGADGPAKTTKSTAKSATKATGAGTKAKKPVRKRKPTKSGASSNQATLSSARTAQMDLATLRNNAAARASDPLWYRVEDVLSPEETKMAENAKVLPEQIQIVETALGHNQMTRIDVTPQAFACLLEQARRYALELLADSQDYAFVAGRHEVSRADLQLASEMRPDHPISITTQLPKLNLLANGLNRAPLPPIPTQCYSGILLPSKEHQLTSRTFDVVSGAQVSQKMVQPLLAPPTKKGSKSSKPSYGATKGRQIPVALKQSEATKPTTVPAAPGATSSSAKETDLGTGTTPATPGTPGEAKPMDISSPPGTPAPVSTDTPLASKPVEGVVPSSASAPPN